MPSLTGYENPVFLKQKCQPVCKPGSVWPDCCQSDAAAIHLGRMLPPASCNPPGRLIRKLITRPKPDAPSLFGLAPNGVYHATPVTGSAVGSYPTLSPLPANTPQGMTGGLLSVALSLRSPSPGVTRHRVSMEPGLSSLATFRY